jgi:hypothetical protein
MGLRRLLSLKQTPWMPLILVGWGVLSLLHIVLRALTKIKSALWSRIWHGVFEYRKGFRIVDMGWKVVRSQGAALVPVDLLRARIRTPDGIQIHRIEETPHYEWIRCFVDGREHSGSDLGYREYIKAYEPDCDVEKRLEEVRYLTGAIAKGLVQNSLEHAIVVFPPEFSLRGDVGFHIMDGVHRAAIAKAVGVTRVHVLVV